MTESAALHAAIYAALAESEALGELVGSRVFDAPPRDADFPYLTVGEWAVVDWSTGTEAGTEHHLTVHAWSRAGGKAESWLLIEQVREALHDRALTLDGATLVNLRFERAAASLAPPQLRSDRTQLARLAKCGCEPGLEIRDVLAHEPRVRTRRRPVGLGVLHFVFRSCWLLLDRRLAGIPSV